MFRALAEECEENGISMPHLDAHSERFSRDFVDPKDTGAIERRALIIFSPPERKGCKELGKKSKAIRT